ncbi:hypothetical protein [Rothia nasimurium]
MTLQQTLMILMRNIKSTLVLILALCHASISSNQVLKLVSGLFNLDNL